MTFFILFLLGGFLNKLLHSWAPSMMNNVLRCRFAAQSFVPEFWKLRHMKISRANGIIQPNSPVMAVSRSHWLDMVAATPHLKMRERHASRFSLPDSKLS